MCGLPTETDEDVLQIADLAQEGHRDRPRGHRLARHPLHGVDRRVRAQAAHAVPVGRPARPRGDRRAAGASCATRSAPTGSSPRRSASATTTASRASSRACCPAATAGSATVIEAVCEDGGRFDGWSEHFSFDRWMTLRRARRWPTSRSTSTGTPRASATTTRCCPWDHLDSGLDQDWLWEDWQDALDRARGRRLPLDAVLRLRRLPADGHRDPGRARPAQTLLPLTVLNSARDQVLAASPCRSERPARRHPPARPGRGAGRPGAASTSRPAPGVDRGGGCRSTSGSTRRPSSTSTRWPPRRRRTPGRASGCTGAARLVAPHRHLPRARLARGRCRRRRRTPVRRAWWQRWPPARRRCAGGSPGLALADRGVLALAEPVDDAPDALARAAVLRALGELGRAEADYRGSAWWATLLHFAAPVADPAGLVDWVDARASLRAGPGHGRPGRRRALRVRRRAHRAGRPGGGAAHRRTGGAAACRARLTVRPRRRPCSGCGCTTPSAAGCGSPATATSSAPSSGRCAGPRCRWPTRPASRRTRRSATPGAAPTGVASEAEYLEIGLAAALRPGAAAGRPGRVAAGRPGRARAGRGRAAAAERQAESLADRLEASVWEVRLAGGRAGRRGSGRGGLPGRGPGRGDPDDQERAAHLRRPGARSVALERRAGPRAPAVRRGQDRRRVRYCDWSYGTSHRPSDPTTSSPDSPRSATSRRPSTPAVTRLAQGPLDEAAGTVSDPLAPDRDDVGT